MVTGSPGISVRALHVVAQLVIVIGVPLLIEPDHVCIVSGLTDVAA
jgi:hypothetical protein